MRIEDKIKKFDIPKEKEKIDKARLKYKDFINLYPFRDYPEKIDILTSEQIYNPNKNDSQYFFYWIEHGLIPLGHLTIGSAKVWENAKNNSGTLKELLKIAVDDSASFAKKVDSYWGDIKGFGGDKHIAKKIISCYYPKEIIPIFKTKDLKNFAEAADMDYRGVAINKYGKEYDSLSPGEKFELLNGLFLSYKNQSNEFKNWDNALFACFLCSVLPASESRGIK
ncbi:MAG: hypothetical protein WC511_06780 [Candidatus Pacearchaeota archaeon]|jgi:hypothetical protein